MSLQQTATFTLSAQAAATQQVQVCLVASSHDLRPFEMATGLWASSARFEAHRDSIETACGQLCFADPSTGRLAWPEAERMPELARAWIEPVDFGPFADAPIERRLAWIGSMARDGGIPSELESRLRALPFDERLEGAAEAAAGLGSGYLDWDGEGYPIPPSATQLTGAAAAALLSSWLASSPADLDIGFCQSHAWSQGRWMIDVDDALLHGWTEAQFEARLEGELSSETWIPLSMALALSLPSSSPFAALARSYAQAGLTPEDRSDLCALAAELGPGRIFAKAPEVAAELERRELDQTSAPSRIGAGRGPLRT